MSALSWIWTIIVLVSLIAAVVTGNTAETSAAALDGAAAAVTFCVKTGGAICLWSGVTALMREGGMSAALARLLRRPLSRLFPSGAANADALSALSENVSANLLGLGNAATPAGIRAAKLLPLSELSGLVVLNSASIQLIPATICAVRASNGAVAPFDILPQVWLVSVCALAAGLGMLTLLRKATHNS